jgi:hypothetical protein
MLIFIFINKYIVMAKASKSGGVSTFLKKATKKRPGVHSKKKSSKSKNSKNYKKAYVAQGR